MSNNPHVFFAIPYEKCLSHKSNKVEKNVFDNVSIKQTNFTYPFEQIVVEDGSYEYYDIIPDPVFRSDVENGEDYPTSDTNSRFMYSWGGNKFYDNFHSTLDNPDRPINIRYRDFFQFQRGNIQLPGDFVDINVIGNVKIKEIEYEYYNTTGGLDLVADYNNRSYNFDTQDRAIQIARIDEFVPYKHYFVNDYVVYQNQVYQCSAGSGEFSGEWDASEWDTAPIEADVFPFFKVNPDDQELIDGIYYVRLSNINESNQSMSEHPLVYFGYAIKTSSTGVKTMEYLLLKRLFTADYLDGDYDKDDTHNQYYTTNLELKIVSNTQVEKSSSSLIEKSKSAVLNSLELPTNNFVNNLSTIRLYGENENRPLAKTLVDTMFNEYKGGKETLEITLPEIPLYDLFGNEMIKRKNGITPNSFIRSNDTFVVTRNGNKMSDKIFLVTSVEQKFDGSTKFYIKAKEKSKDYDFETFEPILWNWQGKVGLQNYEDFSAMLNEQGIDVNNVQICLVVKRHHKKTRKKNGTIVSPKYQPFGSTYNVSVGQIVGQNGSTNYSFNFSWWYGLNNITGIDDLFWENRILLPKENKSTYRLYEKKGKFASILQVGICFKYNDKFTKKSVNCYYRDKNGQYKLKNSWNEKFDI